MAALTGSSYQPNARIKIAKDEGGGPGDGAGGPGAKGGQGQEGMMAKLQQQQQMGLPGQEGGLPGQGAMLADAGGASMPGNELPPQPIDTLA